MESHATGIKFQYNSIFCLEYVISPIVHDEETAIRNPQNIEIFVSHRCDRFRAGKGLLEVKTKFKGGHRSSLIGNEGIFCSEFFRCDCLTFRLCWRVSALDRDFELPRDRPTQYESDVSRHSLR